MAYSDSNGQKPGSLAAAVAIHGLAVASILLIAPVVMDKAPDIFTLINPTADRSTPIVEKPVEDRDAPAETKSRLTPPPVQDYAGARPDTGFTLPETGELSGPTGTLGGGGGIEIVPDFTPPAPVLTTARINPRFASSLQPTYPPGLIRQDVEGVAIVKVLVGTDGRVKDVALVRSDHPDFFDATRKQALGKWRFLPATREGAAVESWREMTVRFEIPR